MELNESPIGSLVLSLLTEARRQDLPYTEKKAKQAIEKVIVTLGGNESGKFTKLAKQYKELKEKTEELAAQTDKLNAEIKEEAIDLFDATDSVYTRIVETVSMTINIGKRTPEFVEKTTKVNYEAIIKEISALVPELKEQVEAIIAANTQIEEKVKVAKSPTLRVDLKEDFSIDSLIRFAKSVCKKVLSSIKSWARNYDKKLASLKTRIEQLQ